MVATRGYAALVAAVLAVLASDGASGTAAELESEARRLDGPSGVVKVEDRIERIVGGEATKTPFPWMVSLQRGGEHYCGGTLIDQRWILTAAHCVKNAQAPDAVVLGQYNVEGRPEEKNAHTRLGRHLTVTQHDGFYSTSNDIALIEVDPPFSVPDSALMQLARDASEDAEGQSARVAGWGLTKFAGAHSWSQLRWTTVDIQPKAVCDASYPGRVKSTNVCAGFAAGGQDSCSGDSGGPLFHIDEASGEATQIGIVSWGRGCAWAKYYGVYTRVRSYLTFVADVTKSARFAAIGGKDGFPDENVDDDDDDEDKSGLSLGERGLANAAHCRKLNKKKGRCNGDERCRFVSSKCRAEPLVALTSADYCGALLTAGWCEGALHSDRCEWVNTKKGPRCAARPTAAPTPTPTVAPTVERCTALWKDEKACVEDWSCEWNPSAKKKKKRCKFSHLGVAKDSQKDSEPESEDEEDEDEEEEEEEEVVTNKVGLGDEADKGTGGSPGEGAGAKIALLVGASTLAIAVLAVAVARVRRKGDDKAPVASAQGPGVLDV